MNTKTNIKDFDIEERVKLAVQNFESGFNCAQSVFLAYSDVFDLDLEMAKNMTVSFGGGVGRMREICGSISAMAMLAGFKYPVIDPLDQDARTRNYAMVQKMTEIFRSRNNAIICRDLMPDHNPATDPAPSLRTKKYYQIRPCTMYVADAARIAGQMLNGDLED